jgi:hypothetical protein
MTKKTYYEKRGRRYYPVMENDYEFQAAMPQGNHLIMCYPGGRSTRYNIDPAVAPMIAASRVAEDAICRAISKASEMRPQRTPITPGQKKAWEKLAKELGDELATLNGLCIRDCAEAGVQAMQEEAEKLMTHASVRAAYEQFLLICKLCAEENNE